MKILIINGPNLNMLGLRDEHHYGNLTLKKINNLLKKEFKGETRLKFYQSNSESKIVTKIQKAIRRYDAIVINAAAYTHTSIAIADALEIFKGIKVEVHLSDVDKREDFRKTNYIRNVVNSSFYGKKEQSYVEAIEYCVNRINMIK